MLQWDILMATKLCIIASFIALTFNSIAFSCEDITMTPKEFYTLAGRDKCYASYDGGCVCRIIDGNRTFPVNKSENVFLKGCKCKMFYMCYKDGPCHHQEICEECETAVNN